MEEPHDQFITLPVVNEVLKPYISYFYFHTSTQENFQKSFTFYPNFKHAITAYAGSKSIKLNVGSHRIIPSDAVNVLYTMNYDKAYQVFLSGTFAKIGIVFHPLGINHFIDTDLVKIYNLDQSHTFTHFGDAFIEVLSRVFETEVMEEKQQLLEEYFLKHLQAFHQPVLKKAVALLFENQSTLKIEEIADQLAINRKQLLRLFQKHLCCSPEVYRKMIRFRHAFNHLQTEKDRTLTDISLFYNYYDQSDFNRQFKSITKEQPKNLLKNITHVGSEDTYWKFE